MIISFASLRSYIHIPNIAHKTQIKYLGIYIGQNLHWGPQIQHINNTLAKHITIADLHVVVIWLQLPEFLSFFLCYLNFEFLVGFK